MAVKKASPAQRIADLKSRFVRIKSAIMAVDALTADYLDTKASELEAFAIEIADITKPQGDDVQPN